jgi:hypothetical protein
MCRRPILPPTKRRIFDCINRTGTDGILLQDINAVIFNGEANLVTIRNHIRQINGRLAAAGTGAKIDGLSAPKGYYRIVRRPPCRAL